MLDLEENFELLCDVSIMAKETNGRHIKGEADVEFL